MSSIVKDFKLYDEIEGLPQINTNDQNGNFQASNGIILAHGEWLEEQAKK